MPFDTSREPLPLVGERCVGDRPFANHVADVFWRLRDGPLELIDDLLFPPALELGLTCNVHDQVAGVMPEPLVRVTSGSSQPLEFKLDSAGI